jgi:hypothetical protein
MYECPVVARRRRHQSSCRSGAVESQTGKGRLSAVRRCCVCVCRLQHALPTLLTLCHLHAPSRCPACPLLRMLSPVGLATMNLPAVHALNLCYHDRPLYMSLRLSAPRLASHAAAVLC